MSSPAIPWYCKLLQALLLLFSNHYHFKWTTKCQNALDTICQKLISPPILAFPDYTKQFIVDTDAPVILVLVWFYHRSRKMVQNMSLHMLTKAECQYSVTRKELLLPEVPVVFLNHFHQYLLGRLYLLQSNCSSLTRLRNFRNLEGQLAIQDGLKSYKNNPTPAR